MFGLAHVSVSQHALGAALQMLPRVRNQLVQLLHRKGDVVLVRAAIVSQRLRDAFAQRPQSLKQEINLNPVLFSVLSVVLKTHF